MRIRVPVGLKMFGEALQGWGRDNVPRLGASLAYYTLLALAPILLIAIVIASMVFERESVRAQVVYQIQELTGEQGARVVQSMLDALGGLEPGGTLPLLVGIGAVIVAALAAFNELQHALNTIFQVKQKKGLKKKPLRFMLDLLKDRLISFGLVVSIGFFLMVSLLVSALLTAASSWFRENVTRIPVLWQGLDVAFSLLVITLLFAMVYRFLPDVRMAWRDVWIGAVITAALFTIGKALIGFYLGHSTIASRYGTAGSVVVLLVWVYYSSQVVLLGAEFTRVYLSHQGRTVLAKSFAEKDPSVHPSVPEVRIREEPEEEPARPGGAGRRGQGAPATGRGGRIS